MKSDNNIMYDGVLYHLPIYQDEIVRNIVQADKEVEYHKTVEGYIILTNYRFVFMEKIEDLKYRLSNFFYYKDIISVNTGGVVNKFIRINGVLFHPKEISVDVVKKSIDKFSIEASYQTFSYQPLPEEEPIPEAEIYDKSLFSESINVLISIFGLIIGIFLILISSFLFYFGPHSRFPFVISLLSIVFSSLLMGLVKYRKYEDSYSEELFDILKTILGLSIFNLVLSSVGLGLELYMKHDFTILTGRNNFNQIILVFYFVILVIISFKIGIEFSRIPTEPENPYGDLKSEDLDIFEAEKYKEESNNFLQAFFGLFFIQILILVVFNIFSPGGAYLVFSWTFSYIPNPTDIIIYYPDPNFQIYSTIFTTFTIITGIFSLILSGLIQIRNIGNIRFYALAIVNTIQRKTEAKVRYFNELKNRMKQKTQRILQRMHSTFAPIVSKPSEQETVSIPKDKVTIVNSSPTVETQVKEIPIETPSTNSASLPRNNKISESKAETVPIPDTIIGTVEVKRGAIIKGSEYIYKIKVDNLSNSVITDLRMIITSYPTDSLELISPEIQKRYKLAPGEMISPTFKFRPTEDCIIGNINSILTYLNAKGEPQQITVEPYQIKLICGLLTPHPIKAEEFDQIVKKLLNYSNAGEEIELPYNAMNIYEKAKRILPHNNFHIISSEDHLVASNFIGILKGFAAGKYSSKKVGIQITINGKKDETSCVARLDGYTEDSSMLTPLLAEIKNEMRIWNCEQCGAQLIDSQINLIMAGKTVRCRYCDEILQI